MSGSVTVVTLEFLALFYGQFLTALGAGNAGSPQA
jgi:hypothetical protein